jgi:protein-tyrosine-phosphatase
LRRATGALRLPGAAESGAAQAKENPMIAKVYDVLFLCTGNSARSIIAECVLNRLGRGRFRAYSAGSFPKGEVHPYALDLLERQGYPTRHLRSKSWNEFAGPGASPLDFVFTVCDSAAGEVCPIWPGQPLTAHWGLPDPAAVEGNEAQRRLAFADTLRMLNNRIGVFVSLPLRSLDKLTLQQRLREIGEDASPRV